MTGLFAWDSDQYRAFAKRYITKRLKNGQQDDVIEELSAYLGDWLSFRDRAQALTKQFEEEEHSSDLRKMRRKRATNGDARN